MRKQRKPEPNKSEATTLEKKRKQRRKIKEIPADKRMDREM